MIYNKIKMYTRVLMLAVAAVLFSCDEVEDPNIGGTSVTDMSGDWYIQRYEKGQAVSGSYHLITTHNTAANDGTEMWIDDHNNDYWYKFKTPVTVSSLSFAGTTLASSAPDGASTYDITVNIANGKITLGDTETSGGNMSNGISFDIEFSDDPGKTYTISGYKRTGFAEDEH